MTGLRYRASQHALFFGRLAKKRSLSARTISDQPSSRSCRENRSVSARSRSFIHQMHNDLRRQFQLVVTFETAPKDHSATVTLANVQIAVSDCDRKTGDAMPNENRFPAFELTRWFVFVSANWKLIALNDDPSLCLSPSITETSFPGWLTSTNQPRAFATSIPSKRFTFPVAMRNFTSASLAIVISVTCFLR